MRMKTRLQTSSAASLDLPDTVRMLHVAFSPDFLDLTGEGNTATMTLHIPQLATMTSATLAIDLYALDNPVHPQGHIGWWRMPIDCGETLSLQIHAQGNRIIIDTGEHSVLDEWINDGSIDTLEDSTLLMHLVLRHRINNSILSQQSLVCYRSQSARDTGAGLAQAFLPATSTEATSLRHGFNWPATTRVHVVTRALPQANQITGMPAAVSLCRRLAWNGVPYRLYASEFDPRLRGTVSGTRELLDILQPEDLVLVLFDDDEPNLTWLKTLECRKAFMYLGVPSGEHLQAFDAEAFQAYSLARQEAVVATRFDLISAPTLAVQSELGALLESHARNSSFPQDSEARQANRSNTNERTSGLDIPDVSLPHLIAALRLLPRENAGQSPDTLAADLLSVLRQLAAEETGSTARISLTPLVDRSEMWRQIEARNPDLDAERVLVCPAPLEPCNDFLRTLEVFEEVALQDDRIVLVAASTRARPVYYQYILYMLRTRFAAIQDRVHLRTNIDDQTMKGLMEQCDGLIQIGPVTEEYLEDAAIFVKPLFVSGGNVPQHPATIRLYGTEKEQARAILAVIESASPLPADAFRSPSRKELWTLLEHLLELPAPTAGAGQRHS